MMNDDRHYHKGFGEHSHINGMEPHEHTNDEERKMGLTPEEILIDALTNAYNFGRADSTYLPTEVVPSLIDRLAKAQVEDPIRDVYPACAGSGQSYYKGIHCPRCDGTGAIKGEK